MRIMLLLFVSLLLITCNKDKTGDIPDDIILSDSVKIGFRVIAWETDSTFANDSLLITIKTPQGEEIFNISRYFGHEITVHKDDQICITETKSECNDCFLGLFLNGKGICLKDYMLGEQAKCCYN